MKSLIQLCLIFLCTYSLAVETPPEMNVAIQNANPGDVISMSTLKISNSDILNRDNNMLDDTGKPLIYSNDPETFTTTGILYKDTVQTFSTRLYLYHVNGTSAPAKVTVVLENAGTSSSNVQVIKRAFPNPSENYIKIGRDAVLEFYENTFTPNFISIDPSGSALLDTTLDSTVISQNQLLHAIYEITSDQLLTFTILALNANDETLSVYNSQNEIPDDGDAREGTFTTDSRARDNSYVYDCRL